MIGDNQMISLRQTAWLLAENIMASGLFWLSESLGGLDFYEMMAAGILTVSVVFAYYALSFLWLDRISRSRGWGIKEREMPVALCFFFLLYYLGALVYSLYLFYRVIGSLIPADYSYSLTILFLLAAVIYGAGKGIEVRGRMAELMGWLIFVPFIILFVAGLWQAGGYCRPGDGMLTENNYRWRDVLSESYRALWLFFLGDHPFLLWRRTNIQKDRKIPFGGLAGGCLIILTALFLTGLFLTPEGMMEGQPFGILLQMIRFPGNFISRYDVFFIMLWMMSFYIFAGGMLLEAVEMGAELLQRIPKPYGQKTAAKPGRIAGMKRQQALLMGGLAFVLVFYAGQKEGFHEVYGKWMLWIGVPVCVVLIPVYIWKWSKVEGNGEK